MAMPGIEQAEAASLFEDRCGRKPDESSADEQKLYAQIGRLKVEVELLKESCPAWLRNLGVGFQSIRS
jgi:hypothetical protein